MQPDGDMQDLGPIRDSNIMATIERPWKVVFQRRHQPCCPFREHRQDVVSALAGTRQMVLGNHEEYLVVQTLQFLSPQFRVAFPQPTEGRHLRGQPAFSGLFIQHPNGLELAFVVLEGERNRRAGIPPPRLGTTTFPGGAPCSAGPSRFSSATPGGGVSSTPHTPGGALDTCGSGVPFLWLGLGSGSSAPSPWGIRNGSLCRGCRRHWRVWWGHHGTLRWRDTGEARALT